MRHGLSQESEHHSTVGKPLVSLTALTEDNIVMVIIRYCSITSSSKMETFYPAAKFLKQESEQLKTASGSH